MAAPRLGGGDDHLAVLGGAEVGEDAHEMLGLGARLLRLRHVQVHLIAVEVRVVWAAHALVEAERPALAGTGLGLSVSGEAPHRLHV